MGHTDPGWSCSRAWLVEGCGGCGGFLGALRTTVGGGGRAAARGGAGRGAGRRGGSGGRGVGTGAHRLTRIKLCGPRPPTLLERGQPALRLRARAFGARSAMSATSSLLACLRSTAVACKDATYSTKRGPGQERAGSSALSHRDHRAAARPARLRERKRAHSTPKVSVSSCKECQQSPAPSLTPCAARRRRHEGRIIERAQRLKSFLSSAWVSSGLVTAWPIVRGSS